VLTADLATNYFNLRSTDTELDVLQRSIALQRRALGLVSARHDLGAVSGLEVAQQQALLDTTLVQVDVLRRQRSVFEHAIATLTGTAAPVFSLAPDLKERIPPAVPLGVPSDVLERRPDVAAAERRVAAANAQIGVAVAAYYPTVTLSATAGFESGSIAKWFMWPSRFFSVGPAVTETVFDGGLRSAQTASARAAYDASVAGYRETVLGSFQDVEDNLAALRILETEAREQDEAVRAAERSLALTTNQYRAGIVSYLNVVIAQTAALTSEQTAVGIKGRRLNASVLLIKALGGGWSADQLPTDREVTRQ